MSWAAPLAAPLTGALLRASVEGAVVVALVALLLRAVPRLPASVRCALWWAACLKLVLAFAWVAPLELPVLPAAPVDAGSATAQEASATPAVETLGAPPAVTATPALGSPVQPSASAQPSFPRSWRALATAAVAALWLLGVLAGGVATLREVSRLHGVVRRATGVEGGDLGERLQHLCRRLGLRVPRLLVSHEIASPQVIGAFRPRLLLPAGASARPGGVANADGGELEMVLAHELAHLRRRDLLLGWVPALAARLFFFHPLAALAAREYALAREAACDAEVLSGLGAPPHAYGRMLLSWGVSGHRGLLAAALGDRRQLKRRLLMLEQTTKHHRRLRLLPGLLLALAVLASLVSVRLVAAPGTEPAETAAAVAAENAALAAENASVAQANQQVAQSNQTAVAVQQAVAAANQALRSAGQVMLASADPGDERTHSQHNTWHWSDGDGDALVFLDDDRSTGFNTDLRDHDKAEGQRRGDEALLWFERDGKEYVVRDRAILDRARAALEPVRELGSRQGELGAQQGKLGAEQGSFGAEQGKLGAEQGRLGAEMGRYASELATLVARRVSLEMDGDDDDAIAELEAREQEIEDKMEALGEKMEALGERQHELGAKQHALGDRQHALGEKQQALGEKQRQASEKARRELDSLLDRAIASGKAEQVG